MTARTIGLIGGMSWESTAIYYRLINRHVAGKLGGHHSASILMYSHDFEPIKALQYADRWADAGEELARTALRLQAGGADCIVLATNTMHSVADEIQRQISIPFLHIADCTADQIIASDIRTVGLMGTIFTMEKHFYINRLLDRGIDVLVPDAPGRHSINNIIYDELCLGIVLDSSRQEYVRQIDELARRGAQAIILGCTEITMLIDEQCSPLPIFDTTAIHAEAAADFCISKE